MTHRFSVLGVLKDSAIESGDFAEVLVHLAELWNSLGDGSNVEVSIEVRGTCEGDALRVAARLDAFREQLGALCAEPVQSSFVASRVRRAKEGA